jgi:hypothetical protein
LRDRIICRARIHRSRMGIKLFGLGRVKTRGIAIFGGFFSISTSLSEGTRSKSARGGVRHTRILLVRPD